MHLLKNGHPAHVFTDADRRKAAAVTNEIRREKRALLEQMRFNAEIEQMWAADEARRQRRREKRRARAMIERYASSEAPPRSTSVHHIPTRTDDAERARERAREADDPYGDLPANERQALERGWGGELG
jgi:hypothetical protein